jgi:SAM-dependent methyltransferase
LRSWSAGTAKGSFSVHDDLAGNPDRLRWNERYASGAYAESFAVRPLAEQSLALWLPDGPVLDLASGPSGSALLFAGRGRRVTAVDVSDVALGLLASEARRRGLGDLVTVVHADLLSWQPPPGQAYALVLCTGYFDRAVFAVAAGAVAAGGLLGWEAFTLAARRDRPRLPAEWCLGPGEPAILLPAGFEVIGQDDVGAEPAARRRMLARRGPASTGPLP